MITLGLAKDLSLAYIVVAVILGIICGIYQLWVFLAITCALIAAAWLLVASINNRLAEQKEYVAKLQSCRVAMIREINEALEIKKETQLRRLIDCENPECELFVSEYCMDCSFNLHSFGHKRPAGCRASCNIGNPTACRQCQLSRNFQRVN